MSEKLQTFRGKERARIGFVCKESDAWAKLGGGSGQSMHFVTVAKSEFSSAKKIHHGPDSDVDESRWDESRQSDGHEQSRQSRG